MVSRSPLRVDPSIARGGPPSCLCYLLCELCFPVPRPSVIPRRGSLFAPLVSSTCIATLGQEGCSLWTCRVWQMDVAKMRTTTKMASLLALASLLHVARGFYLPGVAPQDYVQVRVGTETRGMDEKTWLTKGHERATGRRTQYQSEQAVFREDAAAVRVLFASILQAEENHRQRRELGRAAAWRPDRKLRVPGEEMDPNKQMQQ